MSFVAFCLTINNNMQTYVPRNHITCLGLFPLHMFLLLDVELYDIQIIIVLSLGK